MIKHGLSHAGVVLVSIVSGEALSRAFIQRWPQYEQKLVAVISSQLSRFGINWSLTTVSLITTLTIFGFLWGMAFKSLHSDR